jgi:hypothetical protein
MKRLSLAILGSLILTTPVLAEDDESHNDIIDQDRRVFEETEMKDWGPVYKRADRTIKVGFGLGIWGGAGMVAGKFLLQYGEQNSEMDLGGFVTLLAGAGGLYGGRTILTIGPALVAGGSVRQAKAIRSVNPNAPPPVYGYVSWGMWALGAFTIDLGTADTIAGRGPSVPLLIGAYIAGGIQKGKNRLNWDMATAQRLEQSKSTFTVDLVPYNYEGNRGLALTGTF